jgi:hypothetical protein
MDPLLLSGITRGFFANSLLPVMAHSITSLRCEIWSAIEASRILANCPPGRFMGSRPGQARGRADETAGAFERTPTVYSFLIPAPLIMGHHLSVSAL